MTIVVAGALSCLDGLLFMRIVERIPCHGERLACNIDQAVGAYAVLIYAVLGPINLLHFLDRELALCRL